MPDFFEYTMTLLGAEKLDAYAAAFARFGDSLVVIANAVADEYQDELIAALRQPIPAVQYPYQWQTERQRYWFFRTGGFRGHGAGAGIPYHRTDEIQDAWHVSVMQGAGDYPAEIDIVNEHPKRVYVTGPWQQQGHKITGWYREEDIILPIEEKMVAKAESMVTTMLRTSIRGMNA